MVPPRQLLTFLPGKKQFLPRQLLTFLLGKEVVPPRQLLTFLPGKKQFLPGNCSPSSWGRKWFLLGNCSLSCQERSSSYQATAHLPPGEAGNSSQATAHLPPGEGSSTFQAIAHLPPGEGSRSSQANTHPSPGEGRGNSQAGQAGNQVRSGRQGFRHSTRHRAPQASQENSAASQADSTNSWEGTPTPYPPNRLPQGSSNEEPNPKWVINLSSKHLTPAQRSVLAKGPNFAVTPKQPPNLEYITAIEAACTKLSQQDAEELRADIDRVLTSSPLPQTQSNQSSKLSFKATKKGQGLHSSYCR